ncbi:MAG: hypothetical protein LC799_28455 [Actinobacteria bacterium]|nr:hypothetical protein [Actinomycetota bacterium]
MDGVDLELAALMTTVATTLVRLLTTDGWERAKFAVGALWQRVHPERVETIEAELGETRTAALCARQAGDEQSEQALIGEWHGRLRRLVAVDLSVVDELRRLVKEWEPSISTSGDTCVGRVDMRARATGHSRVTMAGRDIHITES